MTARLVFLFVALTMMTLFRPCWGQTVRRAALRVEVRDGATHQGLSEALVVVYNDSVRFGEITSSSGIAFLPRIPLGSYTVAVSYLGYTTDRFPISLLQDTTIAVSLRANSIELQDVVITAREGRDATSVSRIGREALRHLQPSSLRDVMELLPGGYSRDPALTAENGLSFREASVPVANRAERWANVSKANHTTLLLGTQLVVDGVPLGAHAEMQKIQGLWRPLHYKHAYLNRGVDVRAVSTDDIERLEIVRGIPGAEYSNLTSGLVKMHRKSFYRDFEVRVKADMASAQCYVGKGLVLQNGTLGLIISADYLNAFADPRNVKERFQRAGFSTRLNKRIEGRGGTTVLATAVDYSGTLDNSKDDPDSNQGQRDIFFSGRHRVRLSQNVDCRFSDNLLRVHSLEGVVSADAHFERMFIDRYVSVGLSSPILSFTEARQGYVGFYPTSYNATQTVSGLPFYGFFKLAAEHHFCGPWFVNHRVRYGGNARYAKNFGKGPQFDLLHPVFPGSGTRPRAFSSVPGESVFSFFLEENANLHIGGFTALLSAGVSGNTLAFLPSGYSMRGKCYFDPRLNAQLGYHFTDLGSSPLLVELSGGVGWLTMFPTIDQLFPEENYIDIVEMNYWHERKELRTAHVRTHVDRIDARGLEPARNFKWEVRLGASWFGNELSITYFTEIMRNGFRTGNLFAPFLYRRYLTHTIDHVALTAPPRVEDLTFEEQYASYMRPVPTNGSATGKQGVEWVVSTMRFPTTGIRVTFDGAWLRTRYKNSLPLYEMASVGFMGKQFPYVGYYTDVEGVEQESLNTTLRGDAHIARLGLTFSVALQCNWYGKSRYLPKNEWPTEYVDYSGNRFVFTDADRQDPVLRWLKKPRIVNEEQSYRVPFFASVNLKATKWLFNRSMQVALFVNKILDYMPDYEVNGTIIRRYQTPYFGMEINLKL